MKSETLSPHDVNCDPLSGTATCFKCEGSGTHPLGRDGQCPRCRGLGIVQCMGCDQGDDLVPVPGEPTRGPDVDE